MCALRGREGVSAKVYIYCFYGILLLFKSAQGGGGVWKSPNLGVHTLWMLPYIYHLFFQSFLLAKMFSFIILSSFKATSGNFFYLRKLFFSEKWPKNESYLNHWKAAKDSKIYWCEAVENMRNQMLNNVIKDETAGKSRGTQLPNKS